MVTTVRINDMLMEALLYLITPCSRNARRLGFLQESVAIIARHRRCRNAWTPHLVRSKQTILEAMRRTVGQHRAVILGAGLDYDLPLTELADHFDEVLLVDLVHSPRIRLAAWRARNIRLVTHDVTECLAQLVKGQDNITQPSRFLDDPLVDLVVSLNIASQLPMLPARFLENRKGKTEAETEAVGRALVEAHFNYLARFRANVCLITDVEREILGPEGCLIKRISALCEAEVPWAGPTWLWDIAPLGEEDWSYALRNRVIGIPCLSGSERVE
ncbi:MAG: hypothetical protein CMM47_07595 [Rhodospirillaceae bacterium]|nr:hypothetical protein [Rhodospirillaceae bacterium]